ncbi:hypothetical protein HYALB_00011584 [Hymenoscyphus albidus]|uniref:ABC transporter domain-containing protein n=1 Tax=Hymenoscyphus albidus TaxID=595503 RepID=A0A9N9LYF9_9HELO|nr:hypothetical protein HYALB_00011584 [Hymenoscyphus albidus]
MVVPPPKACISGALPWGPNNNETMLPAYCQPEPACLIARLHGGSCVAQGVLEPVLCESGFYCPENGRKKIPCPEGSYCRKGSVEPIKCSAVSNCPKGSERDMSLIPLGIVIVIDALLITMVIVLKVRGFFVIRRINRKDHRVHHPLKRSPTFYKTIGGSISGKFHGKNEGKQYEELDDEVDTDVIYGSVGPDAMPLSPSLDGYDRQLRRHPIGFEAMALKEDMFSVAAPMDDDNNAADRTDLQRFVQSLSKIMGASTFGLSFEFQDLRFHPKKSPRPILQDVSGFIHAGSLWGVMGASGAGKSTFVNVLMGKQSGITGITKVNGIAGDIKKYKKIIGYVPQDDIVLPELTVRENILHSARVRLPVSWKDDEIQHHVDVLLNCLQLDHVKNSLVGSPGAPVISGGQRKRVSIGMELAAAPMALFLDEPTSGLDATAAASIMATLKALSRLGMTVITVIHQPRPEIFESLDSLVLLGAGRMIYQGPEEGVQSYFQNLGYNFPAHSNTADVMGDIIAGEGRLYKPIGDATVKGLIDYWAMAHPSAASINPDRRPPISIAETAVLSNTIKERGAQWYRQLYFCFNRSLLQQYRMKSSFFFELGVGAMSGFLIGLAQLNSKGDNFTGIFIEPYQLISSATIYSKIPQMSLLVGLAIGLTASAPGVKIFGEEKLVFWREAAAGHNRFSYYMGKVFSTIPRMVLANLHFTTLFMLLSTPQISYMHSFAANLLYFYCIYGLASCVSMVTRREDGPLLAVMLSLIVGVLNGMSPTLDKVRTWHMEWLWRSSPGTWLAEAYFTENLMPLKYLYDIEVARKSMGYWLDGYARDCGMLLFLGTAYRVIAFVGLRFMYPTKQR